MTTIIGIRSGTTGLMVTSAAAGTPLQLEGTGLGTGGRLQLGGRYAATPTSWSDTKILFNAPDPGAQAFSGGWDLYWEAAGGFTLKASTGAFTLLPVGQPVPTPTPNPAPLPTGPAPQIRGLTTPDGAPATKLVASAAYIITGDGFGDTQGLLWINALPATVTQWTETRIHCIVHYNAADGNGLWVSVKRADGPTSSTKVSR